MKTVTWAVLAVLGLGLMVLTYQKLMRGDPQAPWASGFLCVGEGNRPSRSIVERPLVSTRLRLLPLRPQADDLAQGGQLRPRR